ncbi:UNVERIFIED_CONTAM: hypothetical protein Slati_1933200 [Sesamum latifolium]|uniref:Uncharacterized protein n=1 Tax=Sesamum latifolium TaxID=2727402 RepID=A0AAW2X2L5_9LAMI
MNAVSHSSSTRSRCSLSSWELSSSVKYSILCKGIPNSAGMIASIPYTRVKGFFPVKPLGVVRNLDLLIGLGMRYQGKSLLYVQPCTPFLYPPSLKLSAIIKNYFQEEPKAAYDVLPYELHEFPFNNTGKRLSLYPLRKVVDGD